MDTAHPGRRLERYPPHLVRVPAPDVVEPALGRVDHHDLGRLAHAWACAVTSVSVPSRLGLVLADDDDGDHRWNTSDVPFVYTTL